MAGNAEGLDVGSPAGDAMGSAEKENAHTTDVSRPNFQWRSKFCLNTATVRPLPRGGSPASSLIDLQSPALTSSLSPTRTSPEHTFSPAQSRDRRAGHMIRRNFTLTCPFSFDVRDSVHRVARDRKLEELRLMKESHLAVSFTFRANPVRKYKPLVVKQSMRQLTVPKSPFSCGDSRK